MKINNYFIPVAAALMVAATGIAFAQQGMGGNPAQAQMQAQQQMEKELGITAEQKTKLTAISKKYQPKLVTLNKKCAANGSAPKADAGTAAESV